LQVYKSLYFYHIFITNSTYITYLQVCFLPKTPIKNMSSYSFRISIPSLPENIRIVESFIENARDKIKFSDDVYGNIMIAVTESVSNAITHGNQNDQTKVVDLCLEADQQCISCTVHDEGRGFDADTLPDPTSPENIYKTGGRGIFLIKNLADEVNFLSNGSTILMKFYV
jgi:serine/threonine-protein kinase RsbW